MKATILCFFFLLPTIYLFSQKDEGKLSNPIPNSFIEKSVSFFHNGNLYFFDSNAAYKENTVVVNTENGDVSTFQQNKLVIDNYAITSVNNKKHISGEYLYELVYCSNKKKFGNVSYAILKRNLNRISEVEKVLWLDNFQLSPTMITYSTVNISFFPGKSGFYIIRKATVGKSGEQNYIAKYNYDLEEEWKKDFSFTNEKGIDVDYTDVNENDDLLVCIKMTGDVKGRWSFKSTVTVNQSGLFFYILDKEGNEMGIAPKIDQNIFFKAYDLRYYPEKKEVVGFFQVNKLNQKDYTIYGNGYAYMKWDEEGSILVSNSHYFTIDEFKTPEFDQFLKVKGRDSKDIVDKNNELLPFSSGFYSISFSPNQEVVLGYKYGKQLLYKVNEHGELDWTYFMAINNCIIGEFIFGEDDIYFIATDYAENFVSGKYEIAAQSKKEILSARKIDMKSGELITINPISNIPSDYLVYRQSILVDENKTTAVIEYRNTRKNSRKYVTYNL
ncbi:hypothetical protein H9Y05_03650 [Crocinitomicaceae bacterium CZZ-1]|uniref:Uncharacterized protein n=1 Tax=Taishania pollutisoli TaxID=2766479 RepID=A0A8J6TWV4_9FLAO|nr:hypothetical protein [Taishania pollutisoli]MBC9811561.1 hypothetical protein [Taishania pollutisoli]MBX2948502.1 hypothetical protein [Crocinitomicaceae bacterium]